MNKLTNLLIKRVIVRHCYAGIILRIFIKYAFCLDKPIKYNYDLKIYCQIIVKYDKICSF
jgi:hypothetical protein